MTVESCKTMGLLVQADLDNELDAADAAALAAHLDGCAGCAALHGRLHALSGRLRAGLDRHAAPPALRGRVAALAAPDARAPSRRRGHAAAFAAGLAVAAGIAAFIIPPPPDGLRADSVAAHIRALQPGHLVDVASTDQHTVKPWFDGRLDYAPPVRDFAAAGFSLVGGRLDYLDGRPVAALIYRHDKHLIDVFVWPGERRPAGGVSLGYNVVSWARSGMAFTAVSDLNSRELSGLALLLP